MKLVEVTDEFDNVKSVNKSDNVKHLYRVQAAAAHDVYVFLIKLAKRFPDWWNFSGRAQFGEPPCTFHVLGGDTINWNVCDASNFSGKSHNWKLPKLVSRTDTKKIQQTFHSKYTRMLSAKEKYEEAGGNYEK